MLPKNNRNIFPDNSKNRPSSSNGNQLFRPSVPVSGLPMSYNSNLVVTQQQQPARINNSFQLNASTNVNTNSNVNNQMDAAKRIAAAMPQQYLISRPTQSTTSNPSPQILLDRPQMVRIPPNSQTDSVSMNNIYQALYLIQQNILQNDKSKPVGNHSDDVCRSVVSSINKLSPVNDPLNNMASVATNSNQHNQNTTVVTMSNDDIQFLEAINRINNQRGSNQAGHSNVSLIQSNSAVAQQLLNALQEQSPRTSTGLGSPGFMVIGSTPKSNESPVVHNKDTGNARLTSFNSNVNDLSNSLLLKMPINSKADIPVWTKLLDKLSNNPDTFDNRSYKMKEAEENSRIVNNNNNNNYNNISQQRLETTKYYPNDYTKRNNDLINNSNNINSNNNNNNNNIKLSSISLKLSNNIETHQILRDSKIISYMMPSSNNISINNEDMVNQHFRESLRDKSDLIKPQNQMNHFNYKSFDSTNINQDQPNINNKVLNVTNIRKKSHCSFIDLERPDYENKTNMEGMSRVSTPNQIGSCISGLNSNQLSIKETTDALVENLLKKSLNSDYNVSKQNPILCGAISVPLKSHRTNEVVNREISCHIGNLIADSCDNSKNSTSMFQNSNKLTQIRPNPSKSDLPLKKRIMLHFNENGHENSLDTSDNNTKIEARTEMNVPSDSTEEKDTNIKRKRTHSDSLDTEIKKDSTLYDPNILSSKKRRGRIPGTGKRQKSIEEYRLKEIDKINLAGKEENWQDLLKTIIKPPDIDSISSKTLNVLDLDPLKLSKEPFFQIGSCTEIAPRMVKCRSCRNSNTSNNTESSTNTMDDVSSTKSGSKDSSTTIVISSFCRFHGFRKLQFSAKGTLTHAGFCRSNEADYQDLSLWRMYQPLPSDMSIAVSTYIVESLSSIFCEIINTENQFLQESYEYLDVGGITSLSTKGSQVNICNKSELNGFVWKRPVQGVREMCDVCETSIFNTHWACRKCGYSICVDCYNERYDNCTSTIVSSSSSQQDPKERENGFIQNKTSNSLKNAIHQNTRGVSKNRFFSCDHPWAVCTANRQQHDPDQMLKVELIPVKVINELRNRMHTVARLLHIKLRCNCLTRSKLESKHNKQISSGAENYDLHMLADIALKEVVCTDNKDMGTQERGGRPFLTGIPRPPPVLSPPHHPENNNYAISNNVDAKQSDKNGSVYSWINVSSNFKIIHLHNAQSVDNLKLFQQEWLKAHPILVSGCHNTMDLSLWTPEKFLEEFESESASLVDCETGFPVPRATMKSFWEGFSCVSKRISSSEGSSRPACLKLKDWPPSDDLNDVLPQRCKDIMSNLPIKEYTSRQGEFNLATHLPDFFVRPDLGPKLYNAYGMPRECKLGTTNLHLDIADAVNVMLHIAIPCDQMEIEIQNTLESMKEAMIDESVIKRAEHDHPGALWHIFLPKDVPKLRQFLIDIIIGRGESLGPNQDPIHDQQFYLNQSLLDRLKKEMNVESCAIVQFRGDAIFIPAGSPHQVRNLHSCMKVANDFVSPENILNCLLVTKEFRKLSATHANHEDKLQAKNMIFHAIKDAVSTLIVKNCHIGSDINGKQRECQLKRKGINHTENSMSLSWPVTYTEGKDEDSIH